MYMRTPSEDESRSTEVLADRRCSTNYGVSERVPRFVDLSMSHLAPYRKLMPHRSLLLAFLASTPWLATLGCGTVDLGDNFVPPDVQLDEGFFFCRVQPEVIAANSCASGGAGEGGMCHSSRSSLRLDPDGETDPPPACNGDTPIGAVPNSYRNNLEAVRFTVQADPLSSPLYRRPLGIDSHPRAVLAGESDPAAQVLFQWITMGGN